MTVVKENARLELLRCFAFLQDFGEDKEHWPEWHPLFEGEWENKNEDIILALSECTALGHMENRALHAGDSLDRMMANIRGGRDWMVKITPAGYSWIKSHDVIGEAQQESVSPSRGSAET